MINQLEKFLNKLKPKYDDDVVDRCNYLITNAILFICALTVAAKQYVGKPIQCWVPAEFKGGWEQYVEDYCFVESTYFVGMDDEIPEETEERGRRELHYYQWVPFILMFQAFLFMIPRTVWKTFNWQTGFNICALSEQAHATKREDKGRVLKNSDDNSKAGPVAQQLNAVLKYNQNKASYKTGVFSSIWRNYVTCLYLLHKMLNFINIWVQFALLNRFLGPQYSFWGLGILNDLLHGRQWSQSGHFPRVTLCDVNIREIGNTNRKTVQCVLMINMFNEKIFIGIWFWLMIIGMLTFVNLIYWSVISFVPRFSKQFIQQNLAFKNIGYTSHEFEGFMRETVCKDSITVLRLISDNAGELVASEIVGGLWMMYTGENKSEFSQCDDETGEMTIDTTLSLSKTKL